MKLTVARDPCVIEDRGPGAEAPLRAANGEPSTIALGPTAELFPAGAPLREPLGVAEGSSLLPAVAFGEAPGD